MREIIPVIRVRNDYGDVDVRDGVILCFFMRRSHEELAPAMWRALHAYRRAITPRALNWYGADDGDTLPLDDQGWEHIREKMLERPWAGAARHVSLCEESGEAGGYHFNYDGLQFAHPLNSHKKDATSAVSFSFPTEYLLEHGPAHLRALALELARELPFSFGYASLAFVSHPGIWYGVRRQLLGLLERYLGLDLYLLSETSDVIGTGARGAYWLTFLGQPLLGQLGGLEVLRDKLSFPEVSMEPMEGERLLLTLGEWPDAMDTEKGAPPAQYRALARLLEPYFCEEGSVLPPMTPGYMHRWLRRLCL
ncbi:type VI immunity family protein [Pyxidicoccus trucidator]|uniref:type VI immunity family protein n=1 Tax=Pyxidicoccus trucidator TaxID=2709662 RepID=UPI001F0864FB|nr:type VI immunity family protein [Pyxidicoccus trucidator]